MLRVFTASHCPGHSRTRRLVATLARQRPHLPIQLIDLDETEAERPSFVIGTPTFVWDNTPTEACARILFLGNPAEVDLLARLDALQGS